jgi:hypothetical protein
MKPRDVFVHSFAFGLEIVLGDQVQYCNWNSIYTIKGLFVLICGGMERIYHESFGLLVDVMAAQTVGVLLGLAEFLLITN